MTRCIEEWHDLEKGVVLRGLWTDSKTPESEALEHLGRFLQEPLHPRT